MPRLFGRLWRSGGRRAEVSEGEAREIAPEATGSDGPEERQEIGRRLEAARRRLRQAIPPPEDPEEARSERDESEA